MSIPRATVRLQLHKDFTLADARRQVPYFSKLGISHLYLSPIATAVAGSMHGYDVVDPGTISHELGGETAFIELAQCSRAHGMGIILDIVPNHMAAHSTNPWWWDILRLGPASAYADWLDIDWFTPESLLSGKVLAPFLARDYAHSLNGGNIALIHDSASQSFMIEADGARYPLAPDSLRPREDSIARTLASHDCGTPAGRDCLHALLQRQNYVLAWWRCAADRINWRRFFEISGLIGVRVELPQVFDAVHALPLRLYAEGLIDGVRVDHVDGLAQPLAYCRQLKKALEDRSAVRPGPLRHDEPWLIVEKILGDDETLDARWAVHGTTGYDFMDEAGAFLHDPGGEAALNAHWRRLSGQRKSSREVLREARRLMLQRHFGAEYCALLRVLSRLAQASIATRDWTLPAIDRVLQLLLTAFPVYRTYVEDRMADAADLERCAPVLADVRERLAAEADGGETGLLDALANWLGIARPSRKDGDQGAGDTCGIGQQEAITRFQQLTPPLAAKSLEDTAFYRHGRLLSRNEVGSSLEGFSLSPEDLHRHNAWRAAAAPQSMLATGTHDQKRGEDARARLAVLSEIPYLWAATSRRWLHALGAQTEPAPPGLNAERYMLLQTLVGSWPLDLELDDHAALEGYAERIVQWRIKAQREAKIHSSWFSPDAEYEQAGANEIRGLLLDPGTHLLKEIESFVSSISAAGAVNSFAQTILRMTAPGVPDLYQGSEFWDFTLVDPDNRRAVDFAARVQALDALAQEGGIHGLIADWRKGTIKQAMIARTLALRRELPGLFAHGRYSSLTLAGANSSRALAFLRTDGEHAALIVIPRLCARPLVRNAPDPQPVIPPAFWEDTHATLPAQAGGSVWRNVLTDAVVALDPADPRLPLAEALADLPVAVLHRERGGT